MNTLAPLLLALNAALAVILAITGLTRRHTPGARPFAVVTLAVAAWSSANAAHIVLAAPGAKRFLAQLAYLFIVTAVLAWWRCCAEYAGRSAMASPRAMTLLGLPGLISLLLVAAGSRTTLMWTDLTVAPGPGPVAFPPGPWFLVYSFWAYALLVGGLVVVARTTSRAPRAFRPQFVVLLVAVVVPLAVNAVTVQFGLVRTGGHDFTPVALLVSAVVLGFGLIRLGLFDLVVGVVPVAHDTVVESMRDGIVIVGPDGRVLGANPAAGVLLGRTAPPAVGSRIAETLPAWDADETSEIEIEEGGGVRVVQITSSSVRQNQGHVVTLRDVTEARVAEQALRDSFQRVSHEAQHDHLTGLPNRRHLFEALYRQAGPYALVIVDLDGFKGVNDSYGHRVGDDVLAQLARRLRGASRPQTVAARLGGDEFALLLPGASHQTAELAARVAVDALSAPLRADGQEIVLSASAGIALSPQHGTHSDDIVRAADVAMYAAKRSRHRVAFYGAREDARSPNRVLMMQELRRALAANEIGCHYQAQVLPDGRVRGVEALVRWQHADRGLLRPAAFLEATKQAGMMRQLSDRVLEVALADMRRWMAQDRDWIVSVNVDAEDLNDAALGARVSSALARAGVPANRLTVEVTESAVFDTSAGARSLQELRRRGVSVALDDFGTGYGPLAHLRDLPIDELKLDQSFVAGLTRDRRDAALVAGQIRLGHDLGLTVVAEGVESTDCAHRLVELQCDVLQGFHLGLPLAAPALETSRRPLAQGTT